MTSLARATGGATAPTDLRRQALEAYAAGALGRERGASIAQAGLGVALTLAWMVGDWALEPALYGRFLALRLGALLTLVLLAALMRRTRRLGTLRVLRLVAFIAEGSAILPVLPHVDHYAAYVAGFSLGVWASGLLPVWPFRWAVASYASLLGMHLLTISLYRDEKLTELVGATIYLVSATIVVLALLALRIQLARQSSVLAFELSERNRELEHAVRELECAQTQLMASEKSSALGRLLHGLAADLERPLSIIQASLSRLQEGVLAAVGTLSRAAARLGTSPQVAAAWAENDVDFALEDAPRAVATMAEGARRMRQVHHDLAAFVRGEAPAFVEGDLNAALARVVEMVEHTAPEGVRFETSYEALPPVPHQPGQMSQVFSNLLQNALDAVGEDGRIVVESRAVQGRAEVVIRDSGPGVPPEHVPKLFEPFFTTKPIGKGMGLGLATSLGIVASHGGTLRYAPSPEERGARFVIELPTAGARTEPLHRDAADSLRN